MNLFGECTKEMHEMIVGIKTLFEGSSDPEEKAA
jgi:hypothetical protein